jgi:RHS repeat-associated protein
LFRCYQTANLNWLVADQLGTPRMIFDKTGSLANTKRHDYLPFGEELIAGQGARTITQGYVANSVRQKFTSKERDNKTGLDYFEARYYGSTQGRFTSPDDFAGGPTELFLTVAAHNPVFYAEIAEPQSLNKYQYCLNNPLRYVDPDGHQTATADDIWSAASGGSVRVAQGGAIYTGVTLAHDAGVRADYVRQVGGLRGSGASEARSALKAEARQKLSPLGRGLSEAADNSRVGQLATKSSGELVESASRTSSFWNKLGVASEGASKVCIVAGVSISVYNIASAPEGQRGGAVASEVGAWGGALAGGAVGAKVGGAIGTFFSPVGTAIGAVAGGVLGGGGALVGSEAGRALYNSATTPMTQQEYERLNRFTPRP